MTAPTIVASTVYPVAGRDSMELTLNGADVQVAFMAAMRPKTSVTYASRSLGCSPR
jgi:hypothetical protein